MASAFRKPCVTLMLYGSEEFIPYRTPGQVVFSPTPEMNGIPVAAVTHALDGLFRLTTRRVEPGIVFVTPRL